MKKDIIGYCHICKEYKKLSFEHIPPKCACNDSPAKIYTGDVISEIIKNGAKYPSNNKFRYKQLQKGFGGYTLCEKCNNVTGKLYGDEYKKWFNIFTEIIMKDKDSINEPSVLDIKLRNVYPGRFIRQILSIVCSTDSDFVLDNPYISSLILDSNYSYTERTNFRIYMRLLKNVRYGYTGRSYLVLKNLSTPYINEIDLFPFSFIITEYNYKLREFEITNYIKYKYDDMLDNISLLLNIHEKNNILPTDHESILS